MRLIATYSHHNGVDFWQKRELYEWATDVFEAPKINIGGRSTAAIRKHIAGELEADGWAFNVRIDATVKLSIFARKDDMAFQLQTGNISRYAYDLLKLQHLYSKRVIEGAILAVPTKTAAQRIGSNISNSDRIWEELNIFDRFITLPIMLVAFE